ncbi:hypothetical protein GGG87_07860 [Streptococcus sp. zg-86]|uniref:Uncharacterized protein n=1 Tax=Streptococcus zhangguiae TaxID=2664091 RepID=A0A6I4RAN7_9STRE|nr:MULTISPECIES: hypothetical protein [unclassified Streptococcus]MTB64909.1 hypothetical protein [Streptococcus sp. zg-86]MWV56896.1 hypothetical protein [Streptococcus sp. zg-70]QTH48304.1 hypothetical protein J5M87_02965 [Streptococcus sp. zg-86]
MTLMLFILFVIGILLAIFAYLIKERTWFWIPLFIIGGLLIALPFLVLIYFLTLPSMN